MPPKLPSYIPGQLNRPAANQINALETKGQTLTVSGYNELIPVVYGEQLVSGPVLAGPIEHGSNLVYAIAVSYVGVYGIERYVSTLINGVKEAAPAITANPTIFNRGGIAIRLYDGKQTAPDATCRAAFGAEYQDVFKGVSYAVISIPNSQSTTLDPANAVKFVVRGKKCFDPRTGIVAWTENPSLHLADYVYVSENMGSFKNIVGTEECADWNDSLYSGLPRARSGLVINEMLKVEQVLDLFCAYAESLWSYDGETIRIIPDKPVDGPVDFIDESDIKGGSLTFTAEDLNQMPTAVAVFFSDRESEEWGSLPGYAQSEKHELYGSVATKSDVQMPGIYRRVEAERVAWQRLMRLQTPGRISWQMYDVGIRYQAGDVLRLPNIKGLLDLDVRLMSQPELIAPGIYQMHAEIYRADHYPEGAEGLAVPKGAILLLERDDVPTNYQLFSAPEGRLLRGTSGNVGAKTESGQIPTGTLSITITPAGAHSGSNTFSNIPSWPTGSYAPHPSVRSYRGGTAAPAHSHGAALSLTQLKGVSGLDRVEFRLVQATENTFLVPGLSFFGRGVNSQGVVSVTQKNAGKLLSTGPKSGVFRLKSTALGVQTNPGGAHDHGPESQAAWITDFNKWIRLYEGAPPHDHLLDVRYQQSVRRALLEVYQTTEAKALLTSGAIVGFGDGAIPDGWQLCNGQNGTIDLRDRFIEIGSGTANGGENRVWIDASSGFTNYGGRHTHEGTRESYSNVVGDTMLPNPLPRHGNSDGEHAHGYSHASASFAYTPEHYALRFIQYIGG